MVMNKPNKLFQDEIEKDLNHYEEKHGIDKVNAFCIEIVKRMVWKDPELKKVVVEKLENSRLEYKRTVAERGISK